jgi:soluble lytic murein transglycosylase-like protein
MLLSFLALIAAAPPPFEAEIAAAVDDVADVWPVPPALVRAVIRQESAGDPKAVSPAGARGLMQLMPETALKVGVDPRLLHQPGPNILAGVRLLAALLRYYAGDVVSALVAYNSGPKAPAVVPSNAETPAYVLRILAYWRRYDSLAHQPLHSTVDTRQQPLGVPPRSSEGSGPSGSAALHPEPPSESRP